MPVSYLTKEGYQKLQEELDQLRTEKRKEVAERLREAMEGGELIEDAEYEAAKNEQAFVEGRIHELEILLANARVIEETKDISFVELTNKVTIRENGSEPEKYVIVGPAEADPRDGKISNESPLGSALMNHRVGDEVTVKAPDGSFTVHIVKIE